MAGEASQKFDATPGRFAAVGSVADAPSVRTQLYQPTAARRTGDGRALEAIGSTLGAFFNTTNQALQQVDQVNHQQDLLQIERENQALQKQAVTDQELGRQPSAEYSDRHAYAGTYQVSLADAHAFDLSEKLRAHMAKQPLDGSVDLQQTARDFFKSEVGNGTGNGDYDARLLSQFSKAADQQIAAYSEASRSTVLQNTTNEVVQQFTQRVLSPEGITTPQFAEMRQRIGNLVRGDTGMRDKIMLSAIAGAVQNDGQGVGVLRAMQDLGLDQSEPETFNRISGEVLKRTNAVKTFDAGQAVESFRMDFSMERAKHPHGVVPPERVAEFTQRAFAIDSVHGVGMTQFGDLQAEWNRGIAKAAAENLWDHAFNGGMGTHDSTRVASAFGKAPGVVLSEFYDSAMSRRVSQTSPALAATRDGTGLVSPSKTAEASQAYADFILAGGPNGGHRAASQDTISDTYKAEMGMPLIGRDPELMERSFGFYNRLHAGGMTKEQLGRYFPNEKAENTFWAIQSMSQGDRGIKQIAKDLVDFPFDAKALEGVAKNGQIDLAALARRGGVTGKPEEIERQLHTAFTDSVLDTTDRKKWFGNKPVALDSNELALRDGLLADQFQVQMRSAGAIDVDRAVKSVVGQTGKYIVVPGYDGALQAIRDPFKGAGRTMLNPLNEGADHPLSVQKGYRPIYAPGQKMVNAVGETEDLVVNWAKSASKAHETFPGKIAEGNSLYLERPGTTGLSRVKTGTGEAIQFLPGEKIALRTGPSLVFDSKAGVAEHTVPTDPKAAAAFFRDNLGPGWYVQQDGFQGPQGQGYTLYYGGTLEVGEKERDTNIAQRQRARTAQPRNGVSENLGGAAFVYPKP